jgi:hypothetical protein
MPATSHNKAAEQFETAAKAHKAAAELHSKGEHAAAMEKSIKAQDNCKTACATSTEAHTKSTAQAKAPAHAKK